LTKPRSVMDDILDEMAGTPDLKVSDDSLGRVARMAARILEYEAHIAQLQEQVASASEALRRLQEVELPETMDEVGLTTFTLSDGSKLEIKPFYGASIKEENKPAAFGWLEENGHEDLIKNEIKLALGRGEADRAAYLQELLSANGFKFERKESVHPGTLKAFVKEQVEAGHPFPLELFGAHIGRTAKISRKKEK
jgi:hypothetical protein